MAITPGRTGYQQAAIVTYETIFDSSIAAHGDPLMGVELLAETQDVYIKIHGLNSLKDGTVAIERLRAGTKVERLVPPRGSNGGGRITKLEAAYVTSGALLSWNPIAG